MSRLPTFCSRLGQVRQAASFLDIFDVSVLGSAADGRDRGPSSWHKGTFSFDLVAVEAEYGNIVLN